MTNAEFIKNLSQSANIHKLVAKELWRNCISIMAAELIGGGEVALPGIGKLVAKDIKAVNRRNPQTGEIIQIPARKKVFFRIGKELKESLN